MISATEFKRFKHRAHFHRMRVGQPSAQRKDELVYPAQLWSKDIVELVEPSSTRDGLEEDGSKNICSLNISSAKTQIHEDTGFLFLLQIS